MVCREARFGLKEARLRSPAGIAKRGPAIPPAGGGGGLAGFTATLAPPPAAPPKACFDVLLLCHLIRTSIRNKITPTPAIPPKTLASTVVVGAVVEPLRMPFAVEDEDDVDVAAVEIDVPVGSMPITPPLEPVAL